MGVQLFGADIVPPVTGQMAAAGAKWIRVPILWSVVEPTDTAPPTYNWSYVDSQLTPLVADGFTPIVVLYSNPAWAATTTCGAVNKVPLARYQDFIRAIVERYDGDGLNDAPRSPRVDHWEISNEEDFDVTHAGGAGDHGGCFGDNPPLYGAHLRAAYKAVRQASPQAQVIFGGVAYDRFHDKSGYSPTGPFSYNFVHDALFWLSAIYKSDPDWPYFNAMAVHIYNDYRNNWDGSQPFDQELIGKLGHFRDHQLQHTGLFDLRGVSIMLTEASLPSMPSDAYTLRGEDLQSAYPGQLMARAMAAGVANVVWFTAEDSFIGACDNPWDWLTFGLLRSLTVYQAAQGCSPNPLPDYQVNQHHEPKSALDAYRTANDRLAGTSYDLQLDSSETGSAQIEAQRFRAPGGRYTIVAFTDNGERLGRRGYPPLAVDMTFDASILPDWTGTIEVTDHLGAVSHYSGSSIVLTIHQEPIYVRAE